MKRLIGLILALAMVLSLALPAYAEGERTCAEGCILPAGHEGDCQFSACAEGCILTAGHEGDCQFSACEEGCILPPGHEGDCQFSACEEGCILSPGHEGECQFEQLPQACITPGCTLTLGHEGPCNAPRTHAEGCILDPSHEGDCQLLPPPGNDLPGSDRAPKLFLVGENDQQLTSCTVTAGEETPLTFWYTDGVGDPALVNGDLTADGQSFTAVEGLCTLTFEEAGTYTLTYEGAFFTVTVEAAGSDSHKEIEEEGFCYGWTGDNGFHTSLGPLTIPVGQTMGFALFYQGNRLPADASLTPTPGLTVTPDSLGNGIFQFTIADRGAYTLTYAPAEGEPVTLEVRDDGPGESGGSNPPEEIQIPDFCFVMMTGDGNYSIIQDELFLDVGGEVNAMLYYDRKQIMDASKITYDDTKLEVTFDEGNFHFKALAKGAHSLTYNPQGGQKVNLQIKCFENGQLYAKYPGSEDYLDALYVTQDRPETVELYFKQPDGAYQKVQGYVYGRERGSFDETVQVQNQNGAYTVTVTTWGGEYILGYSLDEFSNYTMPIFSDEARRLMLNLKGSILFSYTCQVGDEVDVSFLFGLPSEAPMAYEGDLTVSDGLSLEARETGGYTLKATEAGSQTVTAQVEGETYVFPVTVLPGDEQASGGSFFALEGPSGTPRFFAGLIPQQPTFLRFCYGSYGNYQVIDPKDLEVVGDTVDMKNADGEAMLMATDWGESSVCYTDDDGITHCFTVMAYPNEEMRLHNQYWDQAKVVLPFGGRLVMTGFAQMEGDNLDIRGGYGICPPPEQDNGMKIAMLLGGVYMNMDGSLSEAAGQDFYNAISNPRFTMLSGSFQLEGLTEAIWGDLRLPCNMVSAPKGAYGRNQVLLTFDIQQDGKTCRYYRTTDVTYETMPSVEVELDIGDAKILNTLLSDWTTLTNYLTEEHGYQGGSIVLKLPPVTYSDIIVCQAQPGGDGDTYVGITLEGTSDGANRTTMPGLLNKVGLTYVKNINFKAVKDVKMTWGKNENATCGIMVDKNSQYRPTFDLPTLQAYHPEFRGLSQTEAEEKFDDYKTTFSTSGNAYSIDGIVSCTFDGFEYGVYSGLGGFAGPLTGCTLEACKYGVYIDCNVSTHYNVSTKLYTGNHFNDNWCNVRIASLPDDLPPYYIRFQDNWFRRGHLDFWVDDPGSYYFYRNYFSGKWNNDGRGEWDKNDLPKARTADEGVRGAAIEAASGAVVVSNPCRIEEDNVEKLWVFDTDQTQNTRIFRRDAGWLQVSSEALGDLSGPLNIPILDQNEKTVGSWTVEGGA